MMNDEVMMEHEHPGSTGCQPVVFSSLPKTSFLSDDFTKRVVAARRVAGKLPATTGWQPVLPRTEHSALFSSFVIRISSLIAHLYR
jgi:hypothetical protein